MGGRKNRERGDFTQLGGCMLCGCMNQASLMQSPCLPQVLYVPGTDLLWTSLSSSGFLGSSAELLLRVPY